MTARWIHPRCNMRPVQPVQNREHREFYGWWMTAVRRVLLTLVVFYIRTNFLNFVQFVSFLADEPRQWVSPTISPCAITFSPIEIFSKSVLGSFSWWFVNSKHPFRIGVIFLKTHILLLYEKSNLREWFIFENSVKLSHLVNVSTIWTTNLLIVDHGYLANVATITTKWTYNHISNLVIIEI